MAPRSKRTAAAVVFSVLVLAPRAALAVGAVAGTAGDSVKVTSARVAIAVSPGRTTRWAQITVNTSGAFVWLVPVGSGARVDVASDAWLDALDDATSPVILPPSAAPPCPASLTPDVVPPAASPSSGAASSAVVALDYPTMTSILSAGGFVINDALVEPITQVFTSGGAILALAYASGDLPVHTIRITDGGAPALPFALTAYDDVPVTAFALSADGVATSPPPLLLDLSSLTWGANGRSSYADDASALLSSAAGPAWLLQARASGPFFQPTPIDGSEALPAVLGGYYNLAAKYGDTTADPAVCATNAAASASAQAPYAAACPAGLLATLPGPSPCAAASGSDATPVDGLVCGAAGDAALAVASLSPSSIWVTRFSGLLRQATAADTPLVTDGATVDNVVTASAYGSFCPSPPAEGTSGGGSGSSQGSGSGQGGGTDLSSVASTSADVASAAADGCSSSSDSGGGDSCGSSSGDGGGGSCGGSSADGGGSSCSGSADSSSGGCSGDSSSNDCSTARRSGRRSKSPVSRLLVGGSFVALFVRRLRRRRSPSAAARGVRRPARGRRGEPRYARTTPPAPGA